MEQPHTIAFLTASFGITFGLITGSLSGALVSALLFGAVGVAIN